MKDKIRKRKTGKQTIKRENINERKSQIKRISKRTKKITQEIGAPEIN